MAFRCRADDGMMAHLVGFGSSPHPPTKKNVVEVGPPLAKLSGSAQAFANSFEVSD